MGGSGAMQPDDVAGVLEALSIRPAAVRVLKDDPSGNGNWLVEVPGTPLAVLRRYHPGASRAEVAYEHAVLDHLAAAGWSVPHPVSETVCQKGRWYCLTRYVPGGPAIPESEEQRRRRGRDLAHLDLALRQLAPRLGQRPGWRTQHSAITAYANIDWPACIRGFAAVDLRLAAWTEAAVAHVRAGLDAAGSAELPVTVVHGDFAERNVHYEDGRLTGVIDFGLTHLDSRPYELAIARTYRAPEALEAYRSELARSGWPLTALEEAAITPVYHAFRVEMVAWELDNGLKTGHYDLASIELQLSRTGTPRP
jgi:Ser/Thr protein kinase RdoA (MazF antagonist)